MQLTLFDATDEPQRYHRPPLVNFPGVTWRMEMRALWCPDAQRGIVAVEVIDDATRELVHWHLRPGADSLEQLTKQARTALEDAWELMDQLDEPF